MSESERQTLLPVPSVHVIPPVVIGDGVPSTISSSSNPGTDSQNGDEGSASNSNSRFFSLIKRIPLAGFLLVMIACLTMTTAGVIVKLLTGTDPFMLTAYRNCVIFLCSVPRLHITGSTLNQRGRGGICLPEQYYQLFMQHHYFTASATCRWEMPGPSRLPIPFL